MGSRIKDACTLSSSSVPFTSIKNVHSSSLPLALQKAAPKSGTVKGTKTTKGTQKGGGGGTGFKLPFGK